MHNINTYIGRRSAWHELGKVTGAYMTWSEIAQNGGLDFGVTKKQLFHPETGEPIPAWGTFRDDNNGFLGSVGKSYSPIAHSTGFDMIDHVVGQVDGAHYETAGALGNGEVVWGLADLNTVSRIKGTNDQTEHYLLFYTSHDGSKAWELRTTSVRVVCQNTLNMALGQRTNGAFRIYHTKNHVAKLDEAKKILEGFRTMVMEIDEIMNALARKRPTKEHKLKLFKDLFSIKDPENIPSPTGKSINQILENYEGCDKGQSKALEGSAYMLLNAVTEFSDHQRATRVTSANGSKEESRSISATFGAGDQFKRKAYHKLLSMVETMPSNQIQESRVFDLGQAATTEAEQVRYKTPTDKLLEMVEI